MDSDFSEKSDISKQNGEEKCFIKLVSLHKLIDKPKAWVKEALNPPEIITLDSDSDPPKNRRRRRKSSDSSDDWNPSINSKRKRGKPRKPRRTESRSSEFSNIEEKTTLSDLDKKRLVANKVPTSLYPLIQKNCTSCSVLLEKSKEIEFILRNEKNNVESVLSSSDEDIPIVKLKQQKQPDSKIKNNTNDDAPIVSNDEECEPDLGLLLVPEVLLDDNAKAENGSALATANNLVNSNVIEEITISSTDEDEIIALPQTNGSTLTDPIKDEDRTVKPIIIKKQDTGNHQVTTISSDDNSIPPLNSTTVENFMFKPSKKKKVSQEKEDEDDEINKKRKKDNEKIIIKKTQTKKSDDDKGNESTSDDEETIKQPMKKRRKDKKTKHKTLSSDNSSNEEKKNDDNKTSSSSKEIVSSSKDDETTKPPTKKQADEKTKQKIISSDDNNSTNEQKKNNSKDEETTKQPTKKQVDEKTKQKIISSDDNNSTNEQKKNNSKDDETTKQPTKKQVDKKTKQKIISSDDNNSTNEQKKNNSKDEETTKQPTKKQVDKKTKQKIISSDDNNSTNEQKKNNSKDEETTKQPTKKQVDKKAKQKIISSDDNNSTNEQKKNNSNKESDGEVKPAPKKRVSFGKPDSIIDDDSEDDFFSTKLKRNSSNNKTDETSESEVEMKKKKRKKYEDDSDFDFGKSGKNSSDGELDNRNEEEEKKGKKKLRRIKALDESSDESGEDNLNNTSGERRKKIKKILTKDALSKKTVDAAKSEMERKKRILERQKLYNEINAAEIEKITKLDKIVLDFDPKTKKDLIQVHPTLVKKLKPHQAKGVKFMYDCCFESVELTKSSKGSGCILAHCMGLGKTLQVVSLVHTLITHQELTKVNRVMVVCPLSTVLNWVNELTMWLKDINDGEDVNVFELTKAKQMIERSYQIKDWEESGGVLIIGYEMYRNLTNQTNKKIKKKIHERFQSGLVDPGPDLVVCDEGHLLKNEKSGLSIAMNRIKTLRRIVLTGTPLQNNLKEYFCMINFVKPNLLGTYKEYTNRFVNPITNGQYTDSTQRDIEVMRRRSHVLHKLLDGVVQRRDYDVLAPFLPPKQEYVLFVTLKDVQIQLYQYYMSEMAKKSQPGKAVALFTDFQELQRIWTHPRSLRFYSDSYEKKQEKKDFLADSDSEGSLKDFIDDGSGSSSSSSKSGSGQESGSEEPPAPRRRITRARANEIRENGDEYVIEELEVKKDNPTEWWCQHVDDEVLEDLNFSSKLILLFEILKKCEAIGDKVLVFSQSLFSLDLIQYFLEKIDSANQSNQQEDLLAGLSGSFGSWTLGLDYFRLDGSSSVEHRAAQCKTFNDPDNLRARLFLISTRAGGLGINLVAANRVIIFDVSWNPSHDIQSIFRVYRFGQTKPCYIYRFIALGTMEEKVYERQVTKQAISKRVIDEQQIDRHYNQNDLNELYKFEPKPEEPRPIPKLPKDRLLAELLQQCEHEIYKYHEHESLLENKEEEELNEEERKAAWEEFESEKNRPAPSMAGNLVMPKLQMSVQEATFAMETWLRSQNPSWPEQQLQQTVVLLVQQMYQLAAAGDWTMYNRILSYKLTLQQQQWAAVQQSRLANMAPNPYEAVRFAPPPSQHMMVAQQHSIAPVPPVITQQPTASKPAPKKTRPTRNRKANTSIVDIGSSSDDNI